MLLIANHHIRSFFGQNIGLIIKSTSKANDYIFLKCIKRKSDGNWEKPTKGEGKVFKITLEEIVMILKVLSHQFPSWQTIHRYKDEETKISLTWEDNNNQNLWINLAMYSKMLTLPEVEILKLLLTHILKEKITFGTIPLAQNANILSLNKNSIKNLKRSKFKKSESEAFMGSSDSNFITNDNDLFEKDLLMKDKIILKGSISGETDKALLINYDKEKKVWIPKSAIHCNYLHQKNLNQEFLIDKWILKKSPISL